MARWSAKDLKAYRARRGGADVDAAASATRVRTRKQPNRTEREYEQVYLIPEKATGDIVEYFFESMCLVLGVDTRYYPDWLVRTKSGRLQIREVKGGYKREDAFKTFKTAAEMFGGCFDFFLCEKLNTGEWQITEYRKGGLR